MMRSQAYQTTKANAPAEAVDLPTAVAFIKQHSRRQFDETIELHLHLGVDYSKSDQTVRGTVTLPAGAPKQQRVVVFTDDAAQQKSALAAGAARAGGADLIQEIIKRGSLDADITIATGALMPEVAKAAKILGPKGLMPNPKTGTVTDNPDQAIKELLGGKTAFKMDQIGNIHLAIAKVSWDEHKIINNAAALIQAVKDARPAAAKGELIKSITIKSTMSPAIRVTV